MLVIVKDCGVFRLKNKWNGAKYRQSPRGNLVRSAFHQTLEFTFQQDNLKQKAKSTLELLTKKTVNVPERPSYSFDLNLFENLWQELKIFV